MTWKVSKWTHIGWVGLVSRPCAKVSAASRKLNSSWAPGSGMPNTGISAARMERARTPTTAIERVFLRASLLSDSSTERKADDFGLAWRYLKIMAVTARTRIISMISRAHLASHNESADMVNGFSIGDGTI